MKLPKLTFLSVLILLFAFISSTGSQPKEVPPEVIEKLAAKLHGNYSALVLHFIMRDAKAMADIFSETDNLLTPEGNCITGKENIKNFWMEVIESDVKVVTFRTKRHNICKVKEEDPNITDPQKQINYVAYVIVEYYYIRSPSEPSGSFMMLMRHRKSCDW